MKKDAWNLGRRGFVAGMGAAASAVGINRAAADPVRANRRGATIAGVAVGERVERWRIVTIYPVTLGAVAVVLESRDGVRFQLDVLRRDPARPGVADTAELSVYVSNRGDGRTATDETQGLGAMALAERLREAEASGVVIPEGLLTHRERLEAHPLGAYTVPLD